MDNTLLAIVATVVAVAAIGIRIMFVRRTKSNRTTIQRDNVVGGDQAGGDINKK